MTDVAGDDAALATAAGAATAVERSAKPARAQAAGARTRLRSTCCVLPSGIIAVSYWREGTRCRKFLTMLSVAVKRNTVTFD